MLFGGLEILFVLALVSLGAVLCAFWIWMPVSAIVNRGLGDGEKVGWVIAIVFLHFLGALLYCFIGRPKRI